MDTVRQALPVSNDTTLKRKGVFVSLAAALMLGACAQTSELMPGAALGTAANGNAGAGTAVADAGGQNELQKATEYWGQEFAKKPSELEPALNYARNLKALGEKRKALAVLQQASTLHDGKPELASEYGRLALELDQIGAAEKLLAVADNPANPDWRVISARGTVLAKQGRFKEALAFYERAQTIAPNQPSVLNNIAMAHAALGDATQAESMLKQAAAQQGATAKVQENLAIVLGLQGRYEESRQVAAAAMPGETASANTDYIRNLVKRPAVSAPAAPAIAQAGGEAGGQAGAPLASAFKPSTSESGSSREAEAATASAWSANVSSSP